MRLRRHRGNAMVEFAPALVVFVCFILVPVIDMAFVPVRYFLAQGVVTELTHRLALAETRKQAYSMLDSEGWWKDFLSKCGVTINGEPKLKLIVCGANDSDKLEVESASNAVPNMWLPEGSKGPCLYSMELAVKADIHPLFSGSAGLPGLTAPISLKVASRSNWENLGRDPVSGNYYLNQ